MVNKTMRFTVILIAITFIFTSINFTSFALSAVNQDRVLLSNYSLNGGYLDLEGLIQVDLVKVLIIKDGKQMWYDVDISNGRFSKSIFLNEGMGNYDIYIMVHEGNFNFSFGPHIQANNSSQSNILLSDSRDVEENNDDDITKLAKEITNASRNDYEKARSIYDWVAKNIKYDRKKYKRQLNNDFSDEYGALYALKNGKGVCYDYAALATALGRAVGLEVKLIKGDYILSDGGREYHAWNEVYISESRVWINMDITFASVYGKNYFNNLDFNLNHQKIEEE